MKTLTLLEKITRSNISKIVWKKRKQIKLKDWKKVTEKEMKDNWDVMEEARKNGPSY